MNGFVLLNAASNNVKVSLKPWSWSYQVLKMSTKLSNSLIENLFELHYRSYTVSNSTVKVLLLEKCHILLHWKRPREVYNSISEISTYYAFLWMFVWEMKRLYFFTNIVKTQAYKRSMICFETLIWLYQILIVSRETKQVCWVLTLLYS